MRPGPRLFERDRRCGSLTAMASRRWIRCFTAPRDLGERYSGQDTLRAQGSAYVGARHPHHVQRGPHHAACRRPTAAACMTPRRVPAPARATRCASATSTRYQHACRENFRDRGRRSMACRSATSCRNLNFFMNVPIDPAGNFTVVDGVSEPGDAHRAGRRDGRAAA